MVAAVRRRDLTLVVVAALAGAILAIPAAASAARGFKLGVAASEIRSTSAILWAKSSRGGPVTLEVRRSGGFGGCGGPGSFALRATRANDLTVQKKVGRLKPNKRYRYRFCRAGGRSDVGKFKTAPPPSADQTIRFAWSGDMDAQPAQGKRTPYWNKFEVLNAMRTENNDFNVLMGDLIYSDTEVPCGGCKNAITVPQKWAKYRQNLARAPLSRLRSSAGLYSHWDDHEFINDFARHESQADLGIPIPTEKLYKNGVRAFQDYNPVTYSKKNGIYRTMRWGKNLELFFLDERSFRSDKADSGGACDNPSGSGNPDVAPTAPQANRDVFAVAFPPLAVPPPAACVANINDPTRTMLGAAQLAKFKQAVSNSNATFKVIMNETPIQQYYALPYDRWEGYEPERDEVLNYLKDNVDNVVLLTTDTHANMVNDARTSTLEAPGVVNTGILDVVTGPIATKSFELEINDVGGPGTGPNVRNFFFEPAPPAGVGMQCSALNVFSYGEVTVTSTQLTIDLLNAASQPVQEGTLQNQGACAQVVLTA
jgi:alkaline phosphatase D